MPAPAPAPARLSAEHLALIGQGVSAIVASRDAHLRPSLMRAVGATLSADGAQVTVFLARSQSAQLLQDLRDCGQIAVVFSEPSTHRSVQLKSDCVRMCPARADDAQALATYRDAMVRDIGKLGFAPALVHAMLAHRLDDLVAVSFTPTAAFDQTPGPRAGTTL